MTRICHTWREGARALGSGSTRVPGWRGARSAVSGDPSLPVSVNIPSSTFRHICAGNETLCQQAPISSLTVHRKVASVFCCWGTPQSPVLLFCAKRDLILVSSIWNKRIVAHVLLKTAKSDRSKSTFRITDWLVMDTKENNSMDFWNTLPPLIQSKKGVLCIEGVSWRFCQQSLWCRKSATKLLVAFDFQPEIVLFISGGCFFCLTILFLSNCKKEKENLPPLLFVELSQDAHKKLSNTGKQFADFADVEHSIFGSTELCFPSAEWRNQKAIQEEWSSNS